MKRPEKLSQRARLWAEYAVFNAGPGAPPPLNSAANRPRRQYLQARSRQAERS